MVSKCSVMYIQKRSTRVDFVEVAPFTHTILLWFLVANEFCLRLYSRNFSNNIYQGDFRFLCKKQISIRTVYTEEINRSWQDKISLYDTQVLYNQKWLLFYMLYYFIIFPASNLMPLGGKQAPKNCLKWVMTC